MDNEKLNAIRKRVNKLKETLTGHWSETDQQMLHDLLEGYEELEKENSELKKYRLICELVMTDEQISKAKKVFKNELN